MSVFPNYSKRSISEPKGVAEFSHLKEFELWDECKAGNQKAFAHIYQLWFDELFNYGIKVARGREDLLKDCIQEMFVYLWQKRTEIQVQSSLKFYLFKSLRRSILQKFKANKISDILAEGVFYFETVPSIESQLIRDQSIQESNQQLLRAINNLPQRQKEVIFLRFYEDFEPQEVANIMGLKLNSTYVLLSKSLQALRDVLS